MNQSKLDGGNLAKMLDKNLADFAQKNSESRGRKFAESPDLNRGPFQRDRDRILHASAFRRLAGKMQVVTPRHGDHFRNRLTHTLEVAQIARDLARELRLNEDLAEAIALAHDLGHPPFGHAGERALHQKMLERGKHFEHNEQSLRVVEFFEQRYIDFPGLNLTYETLEGMQKHSTFFDRPNEKIFSPHLEAQLVDIADEISYLSADLEDGIRGKFFEISDLKSIEICREVIDSLPENERDFRSSLIRRIIHLLFLELVKETKSNLEKFKIKSLEDVQHCPEKVVAFSPDFFEKFLELKNFLLKKYYQAPEVVAETKRGQAIVGNIFDFLITNPEQLPTYLDKNDPIETRICDYIAGMTDNFAVSFLEKIPVQ